MRPRNSGVQAVKPSTATVRRAPWSLLQAQWLDVPTGRRAGLDEITWGAFSESFEGCLHAVSRHVQECAKDGADGAGIVTEVLIGNLAIVVSPVGESEKIRRLLSAADRLIARRALCGRGRTDGRGLGDRDATATDRTRDA